MSSEALSNFIRQFASLMTKGYDLKAGDEVFCFEKSDLGFVEKFDRDGDPVILWKDNAKGYVSKNRTFLKIADAKDYSFVYVPVSVKDEPLSDSQDLSEVAGVLKVRIPSHQDIYEFHALSVRRLSQLEPYLFDEKVPGVKPLDPQTKRMFRAVADRYEPGLETRAAADKLLKAFFGT